MYPSGELNRLANRKAVLQARIAVKRWECAAAAAELARPLATIDRLLDTWRRISPWIKLAGIPAALLAVRAATKRSGAGMFAKISAMLPVVMRGVEMFKQARAAGRV